jgi:hypothetical protein
MATRQVYSDEDILGALRAAAALCGEPLSHGRYETVARDVGGPSVARIIQRYGSWRAACTAAGVASGVRVRDYQHAWDVASVTAAVAEYLAAEGSAGTFAGYVAWAKAGDGRPSGATVRNVLGGWNAAKAAAQG